MATSRHDADKENVHKTRIPLPKDPLPALPKHLLVNHKTVHTQEISHRRALKTLNGQSTRMSNAGPSKIVPNKPKHPLNLDTRHVALRQSSVELNWHYTVFNDKRAADKHVSILSISDDETYLERKGSQRNFVENNTLRQRSVELNWHYTVFNDKRAADKDVSILSISDDETYLERKGSRRNFVENNTLRQRSVELDWHYTVFNDKRAADKDVSILSISDDETYLSPPVEAKPDKIDDKVKRLKFNESVQERLRTPDFWKRTSMQCFNQDYTSDVFEYLLANESKSVQIPRTFSTSRACIINWFMKVNSADGDPAIIQSACWYLDSILGTRYIRLGKLQLVAAACFWIAQKLNGPCMPAMMLVEYSSSAFTVEELEVEERAVLIRLKFPNQPIVPQDYITYLSWWCDTQKAGEIEVAATFLAMCGLMVNRVLCYEYPSVIAVAAVKNALLLLSKKELMARLQMCNIFTVAEKKATNLSYTCSILRQAVRTVSAPIYEHKAPLEHYGMPPFCIAQRIVSATNELLVDVDVLKPSWF